jgi:hypothetical protein
MKVKFSVFLIFSALIITKLHAQDNGIEYFVTTNANLHIPFADGDKGAYPILWYDKKSDPKLQIGGFGVGFTAIKPYRENSLLKPRPISRDTFTGMIRLKQEDCKTNRRAPMLHRRSITRWASQERSITCYQRNFRLAPDLVVR